MCVCVKCIFIALEPVKLEFDCFIHRDKVIVILISCESYCVVAYVQEIQPVNGVTILCRIFSAHHPITLSQHYHSFYQVYCLVFF